MALVRCRECGAQVSESAPRCPHCGVARPQERHVTESQLPRSRSWISETILLAALPAVAYALAYGYELGAADFYGYPDWAIRLDLRNILGMGFLILAVVPALLGVPYAVAFAAPARFALAMEYVVSFLAPFLVTAFLYGISRELPDSRLPQWLVLGLLVATFCTFVIALAVPLVKKGNRELPTLARFERAANALRQRRQKDAENPNLVRLLRSRYWWSGWLTVAVGVSLATMLMMIALGHLSARTQLVYWVSDTSPALVSLRSYGDVVVAVPLQADSSVRQDFHLLNPDGGREFIWRRMSIGPLRVERHK
jgi:hypothetical protein